MSEKPAADPPAPFLMADLAALPSVPCPCGTSRRAFVGENGAPCSVHRVEISRDAAPHHHKRLTETTTSWRGKDASNWTACCIRSAPEWPSSSDPAPGIGPWCGAAP